MGSTWGFINSPTMPKEIKDLKKFISIMRREKTSEAKAEQITIMKHKKSSITKFKLRTPRFLYTLKIDDQTKSDKIMQSIPPNLKVEACRQPAHVARTLA